MSSHIDRRRLLGGALAWSAALVVPGARAHEIITTTLRVTHPWSRATAPHDGFAVLCMKFDEVAEDDRLTLVESPVAVSAEMAGSAAGPSIDFLIRAGQETFLAETQTHVRLIGLKFPLEVGREYPLRLGFAKGGVYNTSFSVDQDRMA